MRRLIACAVTFAVIATTPSAAQAALATRPTSGTAFNNGVNAVAYHDGTFSAGGDFTKAHHAGQYRDRDHLAAVSTGGTLRSFAPKLNGSVYALTTDDEYLYVAGKFSKVDGHTKRRVARFALDDGKLDTGFTVNVDALPRALEISGDRLYIGGDFNTVNGERRGKVAAVSTSSGALLDDFTPSFDNGVRALEAEDGRLYVGGGFSEVDGVKKHRIAALRPADGSIDTGFTATAEATVFDIDAYGSRVYAAVGGHGGRLAAFAESDGGLAWRRVTDGDIVAVTVYDGTVYAGGHFDKVCNGTEVGPKGKCLDGVFGPRGKLFAVSTGNTMHEWNPDADSVIGALSLANGGGAVVAGGTFLTFNGGSVKSRGLALFR
jgi:outer membrane protein assembly factor BamB